MHRLFILLPLLFPYWLGQSASHCAAQSPSPIVGNAPLTNKLVNGLLKAHCSDCHSGSESSGDFTLESLNSEEETDPEKWGRVFHVLITNQMPPSQAHSFSITDKKALVHWLEKQLQGTDIIREWRQKMLYPEYGNYVDHTSLFDGSVSEFAWSPSRLWKKSPTMFDSMTNRGMGFRAGQNGAPSSELNKLKQPFTIEDKAGLKDFAAITMADSATLSTMLRNAETLVDRHLAQALHEIRIANEGPIPEDQLPKDKKGNPIRPRFPATPPEFKVILLSSTAATEPQIKKRDHSHVPVGYRA